MSVYTFNTPIRIAKFVKLKAPWLKKQYDYDKSINGIKENRKGFPVGSKADILEYRRRIYNENICERCGAPLKNNICYKPEKTLCDECTLHVMHNYISKIVEVTHRDTSFANYATNTVSYTYNGVSYSINTNFSPLDIKPLVKVPWTKESVYKNNKKVPWR